MNQQMLSETCDGAASAHQAHAMEWRRDTDGAMSLVGVSTAHRMLDLWITSPVTHISNWLQRHWLALINSAFTLIVAGALLTPLLYAIGWPQVGHALFAAYHFVCAQIPSHSYFALGYQLALCARNLAIYSSLLGGSLLFRAVRGWLAPLDWRLWTLTMLPMAWDGGTQLFGLRESNWELRTLTGVIFGLGVCWFLLPRIQSAAGVREHE